MTRHPRSRDGFALPLTVVALALLAVLAAGIALTATRELRAGTDAVAGHAAFSAAELGLVRVEAAWDRVRAASLAVGQAARPDTTRTIAGVVVETRLVRTARDLFWVVASAIADPSRPRASPRARTSVALRVDAPVFDAPAALTVAGEAHVTGSAFVSGADAAPPGWPAALCPVATTPLGAGVAAPDTTRVCGGAGCSASSGGWIAGLPAEDQSAHALLATTYAQFGDHDWPALVARADVVLPAGTYVTAPVESGGRCDASAPLNWGDPARAGACADRFVLAHVPGDLVLRAGSAGQGVLLVDGDVRLEGPVTFHGVIVTQRDFTATGLGVRVHGAVLAADADGLDGSRLEGDARLVRSACAIERATLGSAPIVRVQGRPWAELR